MKNWKTLSIALASFVLAFLLVFCLVPMKTVSYQVTMQKQVTETYYKTESYVVQESYIDQEPYIEKEEYTGQEPYQVSRYLDYQIVDTWTDEVIEPGYGVVAYAYARIRNLDSQNGKFTVSFTFHSRTRGQIFYDTDSLYIYSGREQIAKGRFDNWLGEDWFWTSFTKSEKITETKYKIIIRYKDVTKYRPVTKYRDVVKYRQVEKQHLVWKPYTETRYRDVPMLEYLLQ